MPWCDPCDRFYNPNSLHPDGTCPACGRTLAAPVQVADPEPAGAPWHFKLLVAATALYLAWRLLQGVAWLAHAL